MTFIADVLFADRFTAKMRSGSRPSTPDGPGDIYYLNSTTTLSLANDTGTAWVDYDLSAIVAGVDAAHGGTGFTAYTIGDLLVGDPGTVLSKLGVGTDGQTLIADSGQTLGMRWGAPPGGASLSLTVLFNDNQTISGNTPLVLDYTAAAAKGVLVGDFDLTSTPKIQATSTSAGDYLIAAVVNIEWNGSNYFYGDIGVNKNGGSYFAHVFIQQAASPGGHAHSDNVYLMIPTAFVTLAIGDYLEVTVTNEDTGGGNVVSTASCGISELTLIKVG